MLGNKIGMMQIFDGSGNAIPATVIKVGPCFITQIKSKDLCGYTSIQLGYDSSSKRIPKPEEGHLKKNNLLPFKHLKEYKTEVLPNYTIGEKIDLKIFEGVKFVNVSGQTIGKGYTGNIKRHGFNRGAMTHGSKHHRLQGSLGAGTTPGRVFPGKRMSGRMGGNQRTIRNLEILQTNTDHNLLVVKGSIPGKKGNLVSITF